MTDCPFTLDVDPASVTSSAAALQGLAQDIDAEMSSLVSKIGALDGFWVGEAAAEVAAMISNTVTAMKAAATRLHDGGTALTALARAYEDAETDLASCVAAWNTANDTHSRAVATAETTHATAVANACTPADTAAADNDRATALTSAGDCLAADRKKASGSFDTVKDALTTATKTAAGALHEGVPAGYTNWKRDFMTAIGDTSGGASVLLAPAEIRALVSLSKALQASRALTGPQARAGQAALMKVISQMARGQITKEEAEQALDQVARSQATQKLAAEGKIAKALGSAGEDGGLGGSNIAGLIGKGAAGLAVAGDVAVLVDPGAKGGQGVANRVAAGSNIAGVAMTFVPAGTAVLGIDATVGWVPVAGQVVVLASGVYLAYEGIKPLHDAVNSAASHTWNGIKDVGGGLEHVGGGAVHDLASVF